METLPVIAPTHALSVISESTRRYAQESRSKATRDAYAADLKAFYNRGGQIPATPAEVADFLSWCADAGYAAATIQRRLSAISQAHEARRRQPDTERGRAHAQGNTANARHGHGQGGPAFISGSPRLLRAAER
jgi:hypothetical protein